MRVAAAIVLALGLVAPAASAEEEQKPPANVTAALGDGVRFRTDDNAFSLQLRARIQTRFTFRTAEEDPDTERPKGLASQEFSLRRMRVLLSGDVLDKMFAYYIQLGLSNEDQEPDRPIAARDAYITWKGVRDLKIRFGQMKVPFNRQRVVSSSALQFVDRSLANAELNLDRDVGVQLFTRDLFGLGGVLGYNLGVFGGDGRNRRSDHHGMLYVARVDVRPFGGFDDFEESDHGRVNKPRLSIGLVAAHNVNTRRERSTIGETWKLGGVDYTHGAADLIFKFAGFSLMGEVMLRRTPAGQAVRTGVDETGAPVTEYAKNAWGFFAQAGQLLTEQLEIAARYSEVRPRGSKDPDYRREREIGGAVSYYFHEHALKVQADYFYQTEFATNAARPVSLDRHQARVQFQIYF